MRVPTVRIKNPKTGRVMTVNQHEWARDLGRGRYRGWTWAGGETHVTATEKEVEAAVKAHDPSAFEDPLHIINDTVEEPKTEATPEIEEAEVEEPEVEDTEPVESADEQPSPAVMDFADVTREIASNKEE